MSELERIEAIIDASGVTRDIEARLPIGARPRQLSLRTLLIGLLLAMTDGRPGHLVRVHAALLSLPQADQRRLGVIAQWKKGEHELTYRQLEYTYRLLHRRALRKERPDGAPSEVLGALTDALLEASVQVLGVPPSNSYAVDWTDHETHARPKGKARIAEDDEPSRAAEINDTAEVKENPEPLPPDAAKVRKCADPEASWGHRRGKSPGVKDELFFGYQLQTVTLVKDEHGPEVPELVRRMQLSTCRLDPVPALVPVLERMAAAGIPLGDILADSGYAHRVAENWALPLRRLRANLIQDLHPDDRGMAGTHAGAIACNGNLYCPATPKALFELSPPARGASAAQIAEHDARCDELARYKFSPLCAYDQDGHHRVICPAVQGKVRCPLRPSSIQLDHSRPQILNAPEHPPTCCSQQTITVPPSVNAKTAQKHDYPSAAWRRSYARRTGVERTYSTIKNPASNDLSVPGWCQLAGLAPRALFIAMALIARNMRVADAFAARQAEDARRAANGLPPKRRRHRRENIDQLIGTAGAPP